MILDRWKRAPSRGLGALLGVLSLAGGLRAESWFMGPMRPEEVSRGTLLLQSEDGSQYFPAVQLESKIEGSFAGVVGRVSLTQKFRNPAKVFKQAIYAFPLPERVAVDRLVVRIGDRTIVGEIQEKHLARRRYEVAKKTGRKAALVEATREDLFTTSLANLPPGQEIEVEIGFHMRLVPSREGYQLRFPLSLAEKFRSSDEASPEAQEPSPKMRNQAPKVEVQLDLDPGFALASLTSPSHSIDTKSPDGETHQVRFAKERVPADRDFVLEWLPKLADDVQASFLTESFGDYHYALLQVLPVEVLAESAKMQAREVILVIDSSGSMRGDRILQARAAFDAGLKRLRPEDFFEVIDFDSQAKPLFSRTQPAREPFLGQARSFVEGLQASGGTQMKAALEKAFETPKAPNTLRQVIFFTDGAVSNQSQLFAAIRQGIGSSRLFTVGVGSAPNTQFMRTASLHGRGLHTGIDGGDQVTAKMSALFDRIRNPLLTDIQADLPPQSEVWPERVPDLYLDQPIFFVARSKTPWGPLKLGANSASGPRSWELSPRKISTQGGLARLWAREKVSQLLDRRAVGVPDQAIRKEVLPLALEFQIVTPYTSLVAIEKLASRGPNEKLDTDRLTPEAAQAKNQPRAPMPSSGVHPVPEPRTYLLLFLVALGLFTGTAKPRPRA